MSGFAVWTRGLRGAELSKCAELPRADTSGSTWRLLLAKPIPLSDAEWKMSIDELRARHPAPPIPDAD